MVDKELPPLIGVIDLEEVRESTESEPDNAPLAQAGTQQQQSSTIKSSLLITVTFIMALVMGGTLMMRKK